MYQTGHFFGLISAFNPYLTQQIDVSVNGTSAKYGSSVSSTISIANSDDIDAEYSGGVGTNLLSADGFSKIQLSKNTELQLSARRSFTDALSTPTYDAYFDRIFNNSEFNFQRDRTTKPTQDEQFFFYDVNAKFLYDINKTSKIRANFIKIYNRLDYSETFDNPSNTNQDSESELSQNSFATNISYSKKWNASTQMLAQVYYSNYALFGTNLVPSTTQELIQENEVNDLGLRLDVIKTIDKTLNINAGYQFSEVGVSNLEDVTLPRFRRLIKEVVRTHSIYTEAEFSSNSKNTYARVGLRGNFIEKFNTFLFEPRIAFSQKFLNYLRLEVLGEVKSQSITQIIDLQQDFFGIEKRRWQLANNEDVPIVKSHQFSVGLNYKKNGWLLSAEGYIKTVTDVTSRTQGFQNQFQFVSAIGNYTVKGLDVLINKQFNKLSSWLSYSYSKNDFVFDDLNNGNPFPNNLDLTHLINFSLTYEIDRFKIATGVNWHSGRPFTAPLESQSNFSGITYDLPNAQRLPNYIRADISASYTIPVNDKVKAELGLSLWNIFNQKNVINRFYTKATDNTIIENNNTALALTPNASFRISF
jgi:outer membrane receptor for ferrienterochelin and colicin